MTEITRRELLRLLAGGAAGYATFYLTGCGSGTDALPAATATVGTPTRLPRLAATATPRAAPAQPDRVAGDAPTARAEAEPAQQPIAVEEPERIGEPTAAEEPEPPAELPHMAVAHGADPSEITRLAVAAVGGMERFVRPGQSVIVKPNICCTPFGPEQAATTNPQVVAALVSLALAAGARQVQVMDAPFAGRPDEAYARSGIEDAVAAAGGEMVYMAPFAYADTAIPEGLSLKQWSLYTPALEADVIIDVPIAKHHGIAGLTLGMKNLMGFLEPRGRGSFHGNLHQNIADLTTLLRPALTVVDAVRMLMDHGPTGGRLEDVRQQDTVIASADIVAADAYAATLFGRRPDDVGYIANAAALGLGRLDLDALRIEELAL